MEEKPVYKKIWPWVCLFLILALAAGGFWTYRSGYWSWKSLGQSIYIDNPKQEEISLEEPKPVKILFLGDLMFDRKIRQAAAKNGDDFIFQPLKEFLAKADLAVANLEGPVTESLSVSVGSVPGASDNFIFTFPPSLPGTLARNNIGLVSIANNHIYNFGEGGLKQTQRYLSEAKVDYFGDPRPEGKKSAIEEIGKYKIGFVSYNQFNGDEKQMALDEIGKIKPQVDLVFVFAHWGNEYEKQAGAAQADLAHKFVDAGADLVIGAHPHVIQNSEIYRDKKIYYSLGNFIFDQYFSPDVREGLAVEVSIAPETRQLSFAETRLSLESNGQTKLK